MPPFGKRGVGDSPSLYAEELNAMLEVARAWRDGLIPRQSTGGRTAGAGESADDFFGPVTLTRVKNTTGSTLPVGSVLTPTDPVVDPETAPYPARRQPVHGAAAPAADSDPVLVLFDSIPNGGIGRAVTMGETVATVEVTDTAHRFARPVPGDTTKLASAETGPVRLLQTFGATGTYVCYVLVIGTGSSGSLTVREVDGTPSYSPIDTVVFNQADGFDLASPLVPPPPPGTVRVDFKDASFTQKGAVTTGGQGFAGVKQFLNGIQSLDSFFVEVDGTTTTADFSDSLTTWVLEGGIWGDPTNPFTYTSHQGDNYSLMAGGTLELHGPNSTPGGHLGGPSLRVGDQIQGITLLSDVIWLSRGIYTIGAQCYFNVPLDSQGGLYSDGMGGYLDSKPTGFDLYGFRVDDVGSTGGAGVGPAFLAYKYAVYDPFYSLDGPLLGVTGTIYPNAVFSGGICISPGYAVGGGFATLGTNTFTTGQTINADDASDTPLTLNGTTGQTAAVLQINTNDGADPIAQIIDNGGNGALTLWDVVNSQYLTLTAEDDRFQFASDVEVLGAVTASAFNGNVDGGTW